jgi:hypothetical protein
LNKARLLEIDRLLCNTQDELDVLENALEAQFSNVNVKVIGCVALFSAKK